MIILITFDQTPHVFRQRRANPNHFTGKRMAKTSLCTVQCLSWDQVDVSTVHIIPRQWMSHRRKVDADLVGTTCFQVNGNHAECRAAPNSAPLRYSPLAIWHNGALNGMAGFQPDWIIYHTAPPKPTFTDCKIRFSHTAGKPSGRIRIFCEENNTGRVFIDPIDRPVGVTFV